VFKINKFDEDGLLKSLFLASVGSLSASVCLFLMDRVDKNGEVKVFDKDGFLKSTLPVSD